MSLRLLKKVYGYRYLQTLQYTLLCDIFIVQPTNIYYIGGAEWIHKIFEGAEENTESLIIDDIRRYDVNSKDM